MTNPNVRYYISSGEKNAMRTLRRLSTGAKTYRDEYICNLARDFETAMEKAKEIVGTNPVYGEAFNLNDWGTGVIVPSWQKEGVAAIEMGLVPFGKYKGQTIEEVGQNEGYVKYWVEQTGSNVPATKLIQAFTDLANEKGYFDKWEAEETARVQKMEEKKANSKHIGQIKERLVLDLKCVKVLSFEGMYGITFYNICETRSGDAVLYRGANSWEEGVCYTVRATVKDHAEYKGVAQTVIARPHIMKTIGKKVEA